MLKDLVENICERQNRSIEKSNQIIHKNFQHPNHSTDHTQYNKGDPNNTNDSTEQNHNIRIKAELNNWQQVRYNTNSRQHNRNSLGTTTNNHDKTLSFQNRFSALDFNDDSHHDALNISNNCTQSDVSFTQRKEGGGGGGGRKAINPTQTPACHKPLSKQ